jgi:hypothetical protein
MRAYNNNNASTSFSLQSKLTSASQQTGGIEVESTGVQGWLLASLFC